MQIKILYIEHITADCDHFGEITYDTDRLFEAVGQFRDTHPIEDFTIYQLKIIDGDGEYV